MHSRTPFVFALLALAALAYAEVRPPAVTPTGGIVLLDEYWTPDIANNDVAVEEIDTVDTEDPTQAKFGEVSVRLENETGWPNVRFRGAAWLNLTQFDPAQCEASLWYRTDALPGPLRLEVWAHAAGAGPAPRKVMETILDGGGEGGALIADDEWHEARGGLWETEDFENYPKERPVPACVWITPTDGWDTVHTTYVDRIAIDIVAGPLKDEPIPEPATRVRPDPGAQETGEGWIWWEGEDAWTDNFPEGGPFRPQTVEQQKVLSNGFLLQSADADQEASWQIEVPEDGEYELWAHGYWWQGGFAWRWDGGKAKQCKPNVSRAILEWVGWGLPVWWEKVGEVELEAGTHTLEIKSLPRARGHCWDCWVLTRVPFKPDGLKRPGAGG